jgi:hypothetical protein
MGRVKKRLRRPRVSKGGALASDLGKNIWAMVGLDERLTHFGCAYDEAHTLATKHNGVVMTDVAASRIHGFNELS